MRASGAAGPTDRNFIQPFAARGAWATAPIVDATAPR